MNIYILGPSRSAKTPIANHVARSLTYQKVSASDWIRNIFVPSSPIVSIEDKQKALGEITLLSQQLLQEDPNRCISYIREHNPDLDKGGYVLEGFRNPRDFLTLFNPKTDRVVILYPWGQTLRPSPFEMEGLGVIEEAINWLTKFHLLKETSVMRQVVAADFSNVESLSDFIVKWARTEY